MTCKDYKYSRKETSGQDTTYVIFAELYSSTDPSPLPVNAVGIEGFPANYPAEKVKFEAGSYIYSVSSGNVWMADETGTFILQ